MMQEGERGGRPVGDRVKIMWALELQSLNRPLFFSEIRSLNYRLRRQSLIRIGGPRAGGGVTTTRIRHNNPLVKIVNGVLIDLPSPVNFSM